MLSSERICVASRAAIDLRQQEKNMTTYDVILRNRMYLFSSFFGRYLQPAFCWSVRTLYSDFLLISLSTYARISAVCFGWLFIRRATHMWLIFFFSFWCSGILALTDERNMVPAKGLVPILVGLLVTAIGLSYGYNCGYPINPARDLGPRLFT